MCEAPPVLALAALTYYLPKPQHSRTPQEPALSGIVVLENTLVAFFSSVLSFVFFSFGVVNGEIEKDPCHHGAAMNMDALVCGAGLISVLATHRMALERLESAIRGSGLCFHGPLAGQEQG